MGVRVCIETERGCVRVCVRACFLVSTRVERLPHFIFCLVSVWQLYAGNNIKHSHNQSNETHAGFFFFLSGYQGLSSVVILNTTRGTFKCLLHKRLEIIYSVINISPWQSPASPWTWNEERALKPSYMSLCYDTVVVGKAIVLMWCACRVTFKEHLFTKIRQTARVI